MITWKTDDSLGNGITPPSLLSVMINFGLKVGSLGVKISFFFKLNFLKKDEGAVYGGPDK